MITSFAAREVVVSTMSQIYNLDNDDNDEQQMVKVQDAVANDPHYSPLIAISLMVFYVYAAQCMATFAVVRTETNSYKWPMFMIVYMTLLAYLASLFVYQFGTYLGY